MPDSAALKIERAAKHVVELKDLFCNQPPFAFVVETDATTRSRTAFIKKNETIIGEAAAISGDVIHNLRTALDHAYWEIVSPHTISPKEMRNIQFPFSETASRLDETVKTRLADRVSPTFVKTLVDLKPYGDKGGNEILYLIHELDARDKHRFLIPTCDETRLPYDLIRELLPGFPVRDDGGSSTFRNCVFKWTVSPFTQDFGTIKPPTLNIFEKEIPIPIEIVFERSSPFNGQPVIPTLNQMISVTRKTIGIIRAAGK